MKYKAKPQYWWQESLKHRRSSLNSYQKLNSQTQFRKVDIFLHSVDWKKGYTVGTIKKTGESITGHRKSPVSVGANLFLRSGSPV